MKKAASLLLAGVLVLAFAASLLLYASPGAGSALRASGRVVDVVRVALAPAIDGDLSDWPGVPSFPLDKTTAQYAAGTISGAADLSSAIYSQWDSTYLYIGAVISDATRIVDSSNIWDDDSLEIALDGNSDGRCCFASDHQYTVSADGRFADFGAVASAPAVGISMAVRPSSAGFVIEMAIPLQNLGGVPAADSMMGFNAALNDDDDGGRRDKRLVWSSNSTLDFAYFGSLHFLAGGAAATSTPTATSAAPATATRTATAAPSATATATQPGAATATVTATSTATSIAAATATATATGAAAQTATPSATPTATPSGQPTLPPDERIAVLETNMTVLEGRVRSILDILQSAGRFPQVAGLKVPTRTAAGVSAATDPLAYYQGVNCGGPAYTAINGDFFAADQAYTAGAWGHLGGQTALVANAIANTDDDALYQSERYNFTGYTFDVPVGNYNVTLLLAEIYQYSAIRARVFTVKAEDTVLVADLDVMARVGRYAALDLTFLVPVTDGKLDITLIPSAGAAAVNAIAVRGAGPVGTTPTPSPGDRVGVITARLTDLETVVVAILDIFSSTRTDLPTATATATATRIPPTATATVTPGGPTSTATKTPTRTLTPTATLTPGGPTPTPHMSAKKGVGGEGADQLRKIGVSWAYIWYVAQDNFNTVYEHVPMIWGRDYTATSVTRVARAHPGSYWLIWNEPDYWQWANISPSEAAQIYRTLRPLIKGADPTAKLIVGGVFNLNVTWLNNFRNEYKALYNEWPVVEGWHVHHYVGRDNYNTVTWRDQLTTVKTWMTSIGSTGELWLTEFGCLNSDAVAAQVMQEQVPWLEAQPWLTRYAWYAAYASGPSCPGCAGSLFNADGSLTNLGELYRQLP